MRKRGTGILLLTAGATLLALAGCVHSSGDPVAAIADARIAAAYIPLHRAGLIPLPGQGAEGAATVIAPGFAVTNAHNENLIGKSPILGKPKDDDLLFFGTDRKAAPPSGTPRVGLNVIAYGQGKDRELRIARGVIREVSSGVYFTFEGNAGPGFSGGPVIDENGRLLGIVYGYKDAVRGSQPMMYAYDIAHVRSVLATLQKGLPLDLN